MKAKGIIIIPGIYAKEHAKQVLIEGDESRVQVHTKLTTVKAKDLPKDCKDFEVKNGKVARKVK